jgi:hypothetical protein
MKTYKITLMCMGKAIVIAESKQNAVKTLVSLPATAISCFTETDDAPGGYLVTFVEEMNEN